MTTQAVATFSPPRLPFHDAVAERFGIDKGQWKVLVEAIFPAAQSPDAVVMALSYCKHRNLDVFKKPVHIVPMWDSKRGGYVETIWPSIAELRTTAARTGEYSGCDAAEFGPEVSETFKGRVKRNGAWTEVEETVTFPSWCRITVYRVIKGTVCKFVGPKVNWLESYATQGKSEVPNEMWSTRPEGQLEKCAEAAALRRAFPEELGNEYAAEEMAGQDVSPIVEVAVARDEAPPRPALETRVAERPAEKVEDAVTEVWEDPPGEEETGDPVDSTEQGDPRDKDGEDVGFGDEPDTQPEPEQPKHIEPYQIGSDGLTTVTWSEKYVPLIEQSLSLQEVYKWIDLNHKLLDAIKAKNPPVSGKIKVATEAKMKDLRSAGALGAGDKASQPQPQQRDAGPPRSSAPAAAKAKAAPKAKAKGKDVEIPDSAPKDAKPDTIIKWADAVMSRVENGDQLPSVWTDIVEPYMDRLDFPPDKDELQGVYRHHEKRLAP